MIDTLYLGAIARALMIFLGSRGITLSEDTAGQLVSGAVALVALLWSLSQKRQQIQRER
jgi:hypothetical protein